MVQSQFSLSWDSYKSNICGALSSMQQNGEFVDMTLAADGHFVKVHQMLMALVSPYLKDLITSAPCPHPVIFLNNVSYRTLSCLLEYVYTGEVLVPSENLMSFIETAKALHIKGLEDLNNPNEATYKVADNNTSFVENMPCHISGIKRLAVAEGSSGQIDLPAAAKKVLVRHQKASEPSNTNKVVTKLSIESTDDLNYSDMMENTDTHDSDDGMDLKNMSENVSSSNIKNTIDPNAPSNLQFSVSIRGSLQVILNRYIYNLHSTKHRTGVRRWRCVEYRNHRCKAFVITKGNLVLNRANLHNHSFHDKKILQKIEKKAVYTALDDVQIYRDKQENEENKETANSSMDQDYLDFTTTMDTETKKTTELINEQLNK